MNGTVRIPATFKTKLSESDYFGKKIFFLYLQFVAYTDNERNIYEWQKKQKRFTDNVKSKSYF